MSDAIQAASPTPPDAPASARSAASVVRAALSDPTAWLLGCAGFLARGGIVVGALETLAIPSPAGISLLIPPTAISSSGVSASFAAFLGGIAIVLAVLGLGAAVVAAVVDIEGCRLATGALATCAPPSGGLPDSIRGRPGPRSAARLAAGLVLLELAALLPAMAAAAIAARRLLEVGREEYLVPTSLAVPFVVRVVERAIPEVAALAGCLLLADFVYALGSRWWLRRALRPPRSPGASPSPVPGEMRRARRGGGVAARVGRRLRRPASLACVWLAGWAVTLGVVGAGLVAVSAVRTQLERVVFQLSAGAAPGAILAFAGTVALLVATWAFALLLAGAVSACRAVLWTWLIVLEPS